VGVGQGEVMRGVAPRLERRVGRAVEVFAKALAGAGGLMLLALTVLTVVSILGRAMSGLGLGPVPGDFELVENGVAFAVFAFLPWCQFRRGHVTVDIFVQRAGPRGLAAFALAGNVLMTLAALLIAWRLALGLSDRLRYGDTTFILQMPVWWAYAAALVGAFAFALVCAYTAWRSLNEMLGAGEPADAHPEGWEYGE
jgi:TRAP-type C4-dicarboxylate transport system permease small subunit